MGASDRTTAALPSTTDELPTKKSLFSLLSLPLRSRTRNRNLAEFYVQVDDPHRQYSAGDHVTGSVILSAIKPIRITHLTACLHGYVRVFKNAAQVSTTTSNVSVGGSGSFRYFGNGHAQLFQDEQVLCGEGRLEARRWEFKFDLLLPSEGLPSSIDFERGTISYMITAILTRPTSIAPTTSSDRKISLVERVDVGLIPAPRERKVTMHAIPKRKRKKAPAAPNRSNTAMADSVDPASDMDSVRVNEASKEPSVLSEEAQNPRQDEQIPRSPGHSDFQSEFSAGSAASQNSSSARGGEGSNGSRLSGGAAGDREITATVELLKGGCLPGDLLPVRIQVNHNRRMKSMHGIIVTFFRQGRVDYAPPTSLFTNLSKEDAKKLEREEFYPKSRTGLGGLSLSSAGSCSVFRKDLSQAVAPLIIDPTTLSANITTSVRVPEDVFPSIKGVPGGLISFKYHVEVVVDLGGRLATQGGAQQSGRMGSVAVPGAGPASAGDAYDRQLNRLANWNGTIVDTDHLRREKGVISVPFEVVVGNTDTKRTKSKANLRPSLNIQPPSDQDGRPEMDDADYTWQDNYERGVYNDHEGSWAPYDYSQNYVTTGASPQAPYYDSHMQSAQAPIYVPPPEVQDDSRLSEKERARQAEQRLMPSEPPTQPTEPEAGPSRSSAPRGPSAHDESNASNLGPTPDAIEGPSAPTLADLSSAGSSNPTDDKQELERRRLLTEASAPPEIPDDYETSGPSAPPPPPPNAAGVSSSHEPSAPTLNEQDAYGTGGTFDHLHGSSQAGSSNGHGRAGTDYLPKYER